MDDLKQFKDSSGSLHDVHDETARQAMTGATTDTAGKQGQVPAPAIGDDGKYLRGDGTWASPVEEATEDEISSMMNSL